VTHRGIGRHCGSFGLLLEDEGQEEGSAAGLDLEGTVREAIFCRRFCLQIEKTREFFRIEKN